MRLRQPAALFAAALAALSGVPTAAQFTRRHGALRALAVAGGDADAVVASRQLEEDVVAIDLAAEDNAASLSMSMGAATEFFMAAKAGKPPAAKAAKPPATPAPKTSKAAKADEEKAAKSEKSGKSDLSFSMSLSSKSGKSKSAKTQAPTPCVNPEVLSAKASKSKSAKSDGSYSFSYGLDGSSKSGKADGLSFSVSLPSKSGKSKSGAGEGAAKSAKGADTKASKSVVPCLTESPTESPTKNPAESPTQNPTESPTKNPTESPTKNPTESPTQNPTTSPTPPCVVPGFCTCPAEYRAFNPINATGDKLEAVSGCDFCSEVVTLPFIFNWLNVLDVTEVTVEANGYIDVGFGAGLIQVLFADLDPRGSPPDSSGIYTKENADESFTISYEGVGFFAGGGRPAAGQVFAQATLFADGRIFMCYEPGSIPDGRFPFSQLIDGPSSYPNPLEGFDAAGFWRNAPAHPDGCACFYPGTPP